MRRPWLTLFFSCAVATGCVTTQAVATAITRPFRIPGGEPQLPYAPLRVRSGDADLHGWVFSPKGRSRGLVVYLHGRDNTRLVGALAAKWLVPLGFTVVTYDQRAHGVSGGEHCTYGALEKVDLSRVLDALGAKQVYLVGHSLGAAVALQAAAVDARVRAVVAISSFSDLSTILRERRPFVVSEQRAAAAVALAESQAGFRVQDVSPRAAAAALRIPVLLIHGEKDRFTDLAHSRRILEALPQDVPRLLLSVPGASHEDVVTRAGVWDAITGWLLARGEDGAS